MILFGVTQGLAAGMALMQGVAGDVAYQTLYVHYNFLTLPAGYMGMGMFVIFMLASIGTKQSPVVPCGRPKKLTTRSGR